MSKKISKVAKKAVSGGTTASTENKSASKKSAGKAQKVLSGPFGVFRLKFSSGGSVQKPN